MVDATHIKPLGRRVLIKRNTAPAVSGGILLPESAKEAPQEGKVIAVGPGKWDDEGLMVPVTLKVGDIVLFGPYVGTEVQTDHRDEKYMILSEDDILGVLEHIDGKRK